MAELFASFGLAMLTGVLCIYIVLVLLFKDFLHPVTILCRAAAGAWAVPSSALLIGQKALSMPSLIGLIMLMGIATKNSILLVEYAIVGAPRPRHDPLGRLRDACLQARAADHHDHHRHGRGHGCPSPSAGARPIRASARRWRWR